jgi:hypothetical protein
VSCVEVAILSKAFCSTIDDLLVVVLTPGVEGINKGRAKVNRQAPVSLFVCLQDMKEMRTDMKEMRTEMRADVREVILGWAMGYVCWGHHQKRAHWVPH